MYNDGEGREISYDTINEEVGSVFILMEGDTILAFRSPDLDKPTVFAFETLSYAENWLSANKIDATIRCMPLDDVTDYMIEFAGVAGPVQMVIRRGDD